VRGLDEFGEEGEMGGKVDCYTSLPKAKEECGGQSTYRLQFITQGCVAFPDSGDEHGTVVVEGESRVQNDTSVAKILDLIKGVVGRCWKVRHHSLGEVRAAVVLGWGFEESSTLFLENDKRYLFRSHQFWVCWMSRRSSWGECAMRQRSSMNRMMGM